MTNARLAAGFRPLEFYQGNGYALLPFQSIRLTGDAHLLVNLAGDFIAIARTDLPSLIDRKLPREHPLYPELRSRQFIVEGDPRVQLELLATQYRTRQAVIAEFTALHIFVVTLRC